MEHIETMSLDSKYSTQQYNPIYQCASINRKCENIDIQSQISKHGYWIVDVKILDPNYYFADNNA